jgi:hypothetical protein
MDTAVDGKYDTEIGPDAIREVRVIVDTAIDDKLENAT